MSTSVYSGALAAGATLPDQIVSVSAPFRGIDVQIGYSAAGPLTSGLLVEFAFSTDNATTFSDFHTLSQLSPAASDTIIKPILLDNVADHIKFRVVNNDPIVAITALSISIEEFQ